MIKNNHTVLIYDGDCALCSWAVKLVIALDRRDKIMLSSQQTPFAHAVLAKHNINANSTVVTVKGDIIKTKSAAILLTLKEIGGIWKILAKAISLFPSKLLDKIYDFVARNRSKLGNQTSCISVKPKYKHKFIT